MGSELSMEVKMEKICGSEWRSKEEALSMLSRVCKAIVPTGLYESLNTMSRIRSCTVLGMNMWYGDIYS